MRNVGPLRAANGISHPDRIRPGQIPDLTVAGAAVTTVAAPAMPSVWMTHAAKGLNTDFVLTMTGAPVENRLTDLWCISDVVQPPALGSIKDFSVNQV